MLYGLVGLELEHNNPFKVLVTESVGEYAVICPHGDAEPSSWLLWEHVLLFLRLLFRGFSHMSTRSYCTLHVWCGNTCWVCIGLFEKNEGGSKNYSYYPSRCDRSYYMLECNSTRIQSVLRFWIWWVRREEMCGRWIDNSRGNR